MKKRHQIANGIIITVLICGLVFFINFAKTRRYKTNFSATKSDFGSLETVSGIPYVFNDGKVTVNDGLAHLRVPYSAYSIGKKLTLRTTYQLDGADVLEVGIRKSSFWLDYERKPLRNKILDDMAFYNKKRWKTLEKNGVTIFLSPFYSNNYNSFEQFIETPPKEGAVGIYGSVDFSCPENTCHTIPFQYWTDNKAYHAIIADYTPIRDTTFQTGTAVFSLDNVYQAPDGSFDVMYFSFSEGDKTPVVLYKDISGTIEPKIPNPSKMFEHLKNALKKQIFRPFTQQ